MTNLSLKEKLSDSTFELKDRLFNSKPVFYTQIALGLVAGLVAGGAIVTGRKIRSAVNTASRIDLTTGLAHRVFSEKEMDLAEGVKYIPSEDIDRFPDKEYIHDNRGFVLMETFYRLESAKVTKDGKSSTKLFHRRNKVKVSIYDDQGKLNERRTLYLGDSNFPSYAEEVVFRPGSWIGYIEKRR